MKSKSRPWALAGLIVLGTLILCLLGLSFYHIGDMIYCFATGVTAGGGFGPALYLPWLLGIEWMFLFPFVAAFGVLLSVYRKDDSARDEEERKQYRRFTSFMIAAVVLTGASFFSFLAPMYGGSLTDFAFFSPGSFLTYFSMILCLAQFLVSVGSLGALSWMMDVRFRKGERAKLVKLVRAMTLINATVVVVSFFYPFFFIGYGYLYFGPIASSIYGGLQFLSLFLVYMSRRTLEDPNWRFHPLMKE